VTPSSAQRGIRRRSAPIQVLVVLPSIPAAGCTSFADSASRHGFHFDIRAVPSIPDLEVSPLIGPCECRGKGNIKDVRDASRWPAELTHPLLVIIDIRMVDPPGKYSARIRYSVVQTSALRLITPYSPISRFLHEGQPEIGIR
jgi:hypothetical protein